MSNMTDLKAEVLLLRQENKELRKELSDIYTLHWRGLDCTECPWFDECNATDGCPWLFILSEHMRELGVTA